MLYSYIVLQLALFLLALGGFFQVKKFLSRHNSIHEDRHLDDFKSLVRVNMYVALVYIGLSVPGILMSILIGLTYGLFGVVAVIALNAPHIFFGKYLKTLEQKACQLECSTKFSDEFHAVGETWFKKALPNF